MKILLTAINAKYIHSNLAVYSLSAYAKAYSSQIRIAEFTINNYTDDILQAIYKEKPDFIGFSCYIWNIGLVEKLCVELKKVLPKTRLWLGGPEVSYDAEERLHKEVSIDGIMIGEGEETFLELLDYYINEKGTLEQIKGIAYRESSCKDWMKEESGILQGRPDGDISGIVKINPLRKALDMNSLPFPYADLEDFKNKIIYYETSRGCPYSCSYCLSSIDKKVRFRDIGLVKEELALFLSYQVLQVKFVDRTFNCRKEHALSIWQFIKEHDNGVTNFHFEISADILGEEEIKLLAGMREGLVQLEIGVQSTNADTVKAIKRQMKLDKLGFAAGEIHKGRNIHEHLDLIAGLPYEDMASFKKSFNDVYALKPDQLQLGFLKVLKGSAMHSESKEWGIVYQSTPPYEVLYTRWLSYEDILVLKTVESMVEIYYNSGQFEYAIKYMEHFFASPFDLYKSLGRYYERNHLFGINSFRMKRYEILIGFMEEAVQEQEGSAGAMNMAAFKNILVHDLYLRENLKSRPPFAENCEPYKARYRDFYYNEQKLKKYLLHDDKEMIMKQVKPFIHLEHYDIDIEKTAADGFLVNADAFILYDYMHRNPLNNQARTFPVKLDEAVNIKKRG